MPQIPTTPHPILTVLQVVGFLQCPNDPAQRDEFLKDFAGLTLAQSFAREVIDVTALDRDQKRTIANAPSPAAFFQAVDDAPDTYGRDIGEIFLTVLALGEHAQVLASLNNAVELQIRRRAQRGKPKVTREHLIRKWSEQKPVSHFLAALRIGCVGELAAIFGLRDFGKENAALDASKVGHDFEQMNFTDIAVGVRTLDWLVDFVSIAEELRRRAARTYGQGQKVLNRPLLSADEAWFFAPELNLPKPEFSMAKLAREELDYLLT